MTDAPVTQSENVARGTQRRASDAYQALGALNGVYCKVDVQVPGTGDQLRDGVQVSDSKNDLGDSDLLTLAAHLSGLNIRELRRLNACLSRNGFRVAQCGQIGEQP